MDIYLRGFRSDVQVKSVELHFRLLNQNFLYSLLASNVNLYQDTGTLSLHFQSPAEFQWTPFVP